MQRTKQQSDKYQTEARDKDRDKMKTETTGQRRDRDEDRDETEMTIVMKTAISYFPFVVLTPYVVSMALAGICSFFEDSFYYYIVFPLLEIVGWRLGFLNYVKRTIHST
jgi:hypothetical protein